jgi:hypothetical protein
MSTLLLGAVMFAALAYGNGHTLPDSGITVFDDGSSYAIYGKKLGVECTGVHCRVWRTQDQWTATGGPLLSAQVRAAREACLCGESCA